MHKPAAETYLHPRARRLLDEIWERLRELESLCPRQSDALLPFDTERGGTTDSESTEPSMSSTRTPIAPSVSDNADPEPLSASPTLTHPNTASKPTIAGTGGADHASGNADG